MDWLRAFWRRYRRNIPAVLGLFIVVLALVLGLASPLIRPGDPWSVVGAPFLWPGQDPRFPLGTDVLGRDMLSGLLHGATVSLAIGFSAALAAAAIGMMVGSIAGYYGGWIGDALMRVSEAFQSIPPFLQAIIIVALFGPSMWTIVAAIVAVSWSSPARLVRAETLRIRSADFIGACAIFGMSDARIILTQILPNCLPPLIVSTSVMVASAILLEAGLSFLGLGDPSQLSWGAMISIGRGALRTAWYMTALPGVAIIITVMGINLMGDGLNDAFNPYLRERARQ
jgi:peptide/nickel transport system permease protein